MKFNSILLNFNKGFFMKTIFKYILVLAIIFSISSAVYAEGTKAEIDKIAPGFTLVDSYGITYSLSDFDGQYIVLEWINYDCPFVVKHYASKNMQNLQKKYSDLGVAWLTICSSAPGKQGHFEADEINKRSKEYGANFKAYLIDEDGTVGKMYEAATTPHMYVINPEGILIYAGAIDSIRSTDQADIPKSENYVEKALTEAMGGKPVTTKVTKAYGCSVKY